MKGSLHESLVCDGARYVDERTGVTVCWEGFFLPEQQAAIPAKAVVKCYFEHGPNFPAHLNGSFALALHDPRNQTFILARDFAGTVPLYYATTQDGGVAFGSRIADVLPHLPSVQLNERKLLDYLAFFWSLGDETFFKGVHLLGQGSMLLNGVALPYFRFEHHPIVIAENDAIAQIRTALEQSVRCRMRPALGCHLSGGVDSSAVSAIYTGLMDTPPPCFVASFEADPSYDEVPYALEVAQQTGCHLEIVPTSPEDVFAYLRETALAMEEPKCHPPVLPRFKIEQRAAAMGVRAIANGRGADELFTGYDWHRASQLEDHKRRRLVFSREDRKRLLTDDFLRGVDYDPEDEYDREFGRCEGTTALERVMAMDWHTILANWVVLDYKLSMHFGTQALSPFLDHEVIRLACSLPVSLKYPDDRPKYLLKEAVRPWVPESVLTRPKVGFRTPMGEMLRCVPPDAVRRYLLQDGPFTTIFRASAVEAEITRQYEGAENRGWQIWAFLLFKTWLDTYLR